MVYRLFFRLVLARVDPETVHALAARGLRRVLRRRGVAAAVRAALAPRRPELEVRALGSSFPSPLGVAAGMDKDADWHAELGALGFGFVEIGTVTALAQPGNPRPRIRRLVGDRALLNSMGFPNAGADAAAGRLRRRGRGGDTVLGVNVGKSKAVPLEAAPQDYRATVARLGPFADYLVLNVSSPNTPRLREMQSAGALQELVGAVRDELAVLRTDVPILVKIAPDLSDHELDGVTDVAVGLKLAGIVAVNTTLSRAGLGDGHGLAGVPGGISGAPLKDRAVEVLERIRARAGDELVLVSVGGVETAADVWERILAGATLVQTYTGFVYGGPLWPRRVNRELARRVRAAGARSIGELVGAGVGASTPTPTPSRPGSKPSPEAYATRSGRSG